MIPPDSAGMTGFQQEPQGHDKDLSLMAESSSNNPDLTRALQTVVQNLLPPAFQVGDSTQPR